MAFIIRDGWTETDEFPGQHWMGKFKFTYRPALHDRVTEYRETVKSGGSAKATVIEQRRFLKEHLVSWEIQDSPDGAPLKTTDDNVYVHLPAPIVDFIWGCIAGYGPDRWKDAVKNSSSPSA